MPENQTFKITGKPTLGQGKLDLAIKFDPKSLTITETPFGALLNLENGHISGEPGTPAFPMQMLRVALPAYSDITDFRVTVAKKVAMTAKAVFVAPVQEPRAGAKEPKSSLGVTVTSLKPSLALSKISFLEKPDYVSKSRGVTLPRLKEYQRVLSQPAPVVRLASIEHRGVASIAVLEVNPVTQNSNGIIELATDIKITLTYDSTKNSKKVDLILGSRDFKRVRSKAEATRMSDILKNEVINPDWVFDVSDLFPLLLTDCDYLIITDNQKWDEKLMTPSGAAGDLVASFNKLAQWKKKRGLRTRIVTITNIVNGTYGNFKNGARDLQEVLRNFLKWAYANWNISWVLLGGDISVIPIRTIAGNCRGFIDVNTTNPPENNKSFWTGAFLKMHVVDPGEWWPGNVPLILVNPALGTVIPFDSAGTSSAAHPGWYYTTDDNYNVRSVATTTFVKVNGPAALINATLEWLYQWNTIPTDLYYSSLTGPNYSLPATHDWDLVNNEIYGQHNGGTNHDGVSYVADIGLGRAPVSSVAEADAFINKVIAYEQLRRPDGTALDLKTGLAA